MENHICGGRNVPAPNMTIQSTSIRVQGKTGIHVTLKRIPPPTLTMHYYSLGAFSLCLVDTTESQKESFLKNIYPKFFRMRDKT